MVSLLDFNVILPKMNGLNLGKFKKSKVILDLPANQHSQLSPNSLHFGWIGFTDYRINSKMVIMILIFRQLGLDNSF